LVIGIVLLLLAGSGIAGWRWWHNRPPYGPEALAATASLRLVDQATADAAFSPQAMQQAGAGDQIFLGSVAWSRPPRADVTFRIVVLDKRTRLMPGFINATSARPDGIVNGSDESLDRAERRYPWLQGIGAREVNGQFWTAGIAITVSSVEASPVTLAVVLSRQISGSPPHLAVASAPAAVGDLLVALISVGPDGQVYWAQRLLN
jgi:hypothetical protein